MQHLKTFFIASLSDIRTFMAIHNDSIEWHSIPLDTANPQGLQLMCAIFNNEYVEAEWAAIPTVQPLAHPLSGKAVSPQHALLLKRFGVLPSDTLLDIAHKAKDFHPCMRVTGFWQ